MKDYTVLEALKRTAASKIENAFERGYEQGYQDGQKDSQKSKGEAVANEIIACKEAYQKGLKHGQELRVKETECAEACGMRRVWDVAKKLVLSEENGGLSYTEIREIFGEFSYPEVFKDFTASEAIKKVEEYEKKQKIQKTNEKLKYLDAFCKDNVCKGGCPLYTKEFHCGRGSCWTPDGLKDGEDVDKAYEIVKEYEKKQKEQTQEPKNKVGEKICGSCNCIRLFY